MPRPIHAALALLPVVSHVVPAQAVRMFESVPVADGIHAFIAPEAGIVSGNSVAIIGDSAVLVVDAGHFPAVTRDMIAALRKLTDRPVRYLVNTHWHPDHWTGNAEYAAAFPGLTIISTTHTRGRIAAIGPAYLRLYQDSAAIARQARGPLDSGKNPDGTPLSEDQRAYSTAVVADVPHAVAAWRGARLALPQVTFDDSLRLQLGGREVQVKFLGRGNTAGDAVVFVPDSRTLITGDLLVHPTPFAYGSYFADWIVTLEKLKSLDARAIVPGHGAVQRDSTYLTLVLELLRSIQRQVTDAVRRNLDLEQTRKALDLTEFEQRLVGSNPLRRARFRLDFLAPGIGRAFDGVRFELGR